MDGGEGLGRKRGTGMHGLGSGMRERGLGRAGWIGEWYEGERIGQGWMDIGL